MLWNSQPSDPVCIDDAETLAEQLSKHASQLTPQDLTNLLKYTAYARLLIDGMPSNPFSMQTLSPLDITDDRFAIVSERSRREHAQAFETIHAAIAGQLRR